MLLLFDIDHTLVHTVPTRVDTFENFEIAIDGAMWYVHVRPHAIAFIQALFRLRKPWGVWTMGSRDYMDRVLRGLFALAGSEKHYTQVLDVYRAREDSKTLIKDLSSLGTEQVVLYDDDLLHYHFPSNQGRVVPVPRFDVRESFAKIDFFFYMLRCEHDSDFSKEVVSKTLPR